MINQKMAQPSSAGISQPGAAILGVVLSKKEAGLRLHFH